MSIINAQKGPNCVRLSNGAEHHVGGALEADILDGLANKIRLRAIRPSKASTPFQLRLMVAIRARGTQSRGRFAGSE